jgi:Fe-S oxidoreductase
VTEYLGTLDLPEPVNPQGALVAYHSACSMQHGQKIDALPKQLLARAGFRVRDIPEGHLCCGSAGTYNIWSRRLPCGCAIARSLTSCKHLPISLRPAISAA